jgi:hypothetical protein
VNDGSLTNRRYCLIKPHKESLMRTLILLAGAILIPSLVQAQTWAQRMGAGARTAVNKTTQTTQQAATAAKQTWDNGASQRGQAVDEAKRATGRAVSAGEQKWSQTAPQRRELARKTEDGIKAAAAHGTAAIVATGKTVSHSGPAIARAGKTVQSKTVTGARAAGKDGRDFKKGWDSKAPAQRRP